VENPSGQWQGYKDTYSDTITNHGPVAWRDKRAWGVSDWASRGGMGSYFDWVTANAILPSDTSALRAANQRIDRGTVADLAQIPAMYRVLEGQMLTADFGLNPLGLASNAIPFSINSGLIGTKNHFEQTYDKAQPALDNAKRVFDYARNLTGELRKQMDDEGQFARVRGERERDLTGRLIEVFGYPYQDDIGPGKLYNFNGDPAQYDGPDIFKYDVVDLEDIIGEPDGGVQTYSVRVRSDEETSPGVPAYGNTCTSGQPDVHCVEFSLSTSGYGNIRDPQGPKSTRKAPGEIQLARGDLLQSRRRLEQGLANYDNLLAKIESQRDLLEAQYNVGNLEIQILRDAATQQRDLNSELKSLRIKQLTFRRIAEQGQRIANATAESMPGVFGVIAGLAAGTVTDIGSFTKGPLKAVAAVATLAASVASDAAQFEEMDVQKAKEDTQAAATISITSARNDFAVLQQQKVLEELVRQEPVQRLELYALTTAINQTQGRYLAAVQRGVRLLEERDIFRREESSDAVLRRYKNMAYRIYRDDAIQRYRAMFDQAARMVYLTAKAFDYETNAFADATDATAGSRFLTNIVRSRSLGLQDGFAGGESSLADIMDSMKGAYDGTYKPQLAEELVSTKFSLRVENFGILPDESGITATARADANRRWREKLASYVVPVLSEHPDYKEFCFPLTTQAAADGPAIVIDDISTTIADGVNFFGNQFNAYGSSQYNPQRASHKIKKMGVWYSNYNTAFQGLTGTPYMYFFPAGADLMRSPFDLQDLRSFTVYNQIIPTAQSFSVSGTNFQKPYWLPEVSAFGAVDNNLGTRVRYLTFRAFNSSATSLAADTIVPGSTELSLSANVGRSVWNDRWVLIIPGSGLGTTADYNENIQRFIYGPLIAGGNGARDNTKAVTDIKLSFLTYAMNPIGGGTK
jgi:hypothetical protein